MNHREASFISYYVGAWVKQYSKANSISVVYEAKETDTTLGDNDFEPQQLPSLRAAETPGGCYHKVADGSGLAAPFDGFCIRKAHAFVAVMFRNKGWAMIRINDWDARGKKRISFEDAQQMTNYWYK